MDYSFIFRQLQSILTNNRITLIPLTLILFNLLIFIVSKTFRKTGLFLLALAFGLDYTIKSIPLTYILLFHGYIMPLLSYMLWDFWYFL